MAHAKISKSYFEFEYKSPLTEFVTDIKRRFGVETYLGYWVPKKIIDEIFAGHGFDDFKERLSTSLKEQREAMAEAIRNDRENLVRLNLINGDNNADPVAAF